MPRNFLKAPLIQLLGLIPLLAAAITIRPAYAESARPALVSASPEPEAVLVASPEIVSLDFGSALADEGSSLQVLDGEGDQVDNGDPFIDPADRSQISVSLPPLIEGVYTVRYAVREIGGSVFVVSEYTFTVRPPAPVLNVQQPVDGQSFSSGDITLDMTAQFFDFSTFENRIRIYVDGELEDEIRSLHYDLSLSPGVHQLRVVLARLEDEELEETQTVINIAVAEPPQPVKPPPATSTLGNLPLTPQAQIIAIILTLALLVVGFMLGRQPDERDL